MKNAREVGPQRQRFREHPMADSKMQQSFETDCQLGMLPDARLERSNGDYRQHNTSLGYAIYRRGWMGQKAHMDHCIALVLKSTTDPEEHEALQRAYTKLRMAL